MPKLQHQSPQGQVDCWNAAHPEPGVKVAVRRDSGTTANNHRVSAWLIERRIAAWARRRRRYEG